MDVKILKLFSILVILLVFNNCKKEPTTPSFDKSVCENLTNTSASGTANILSDGGSLIVTRGVCWSTNQNPTLNENTKNYGSGDGLFSWSIGSLIPETDYYLRAFATNSIGTFYSEQISFKTKTAVNFFSKTFGGKLSEQSYQIIQTNDKGYILTGYTSSNDVDFGGILHKGVNDVFIMKLLSDGTKQWVKTFGGRDIDSGYSICQSNDGGYYITGDFVDYSGDFSGIGVGKDDVFVLKLRSNGDKEWIKAIAGSGLNAYTILSTLDGGCIVSGNFANNDGDFYGKSKGSYDIFIAKLTSNGIIEWIKSIGGTLNDNGSMMSQTSDGGYIITGQTLSTDGDVGVENKGLGDILIIKLNSNGEKQWVKTLGGSNIDKGMSIVQTMDSGFILAGSFYSSDGDFLGLNKGGMDIFILKMDTNGGKQWMKTLGGSSTDWVKSIVQTSDGGYVLTGQFSSNNGDFITISKGQIDNFIIKLNSSGERQWIKSFGGSKDDNANSVIQSRDGGIVFTGSYSSNDGDFININRGYSDIFVFKLNSLGNFSNY